MECSVCLEAFDREVRRPKSLPCGHSFCLRCLQNPDFGNHCPQDRRAFRNEPIVNLPDNFNVLSMLGDGAARDEAVWCEACDRQFSGDCADAGHRPCSVRRRRALQDQRGPDVQQGLQDLRRELQELRQQVEDQQRGAAPPRLHLDVQEMSVEEGMLKERNDLLLSGRLDQVRNLTGLSCHPFAEWSEAVLRKVRPHLVELSVRAATLKHLRVIRDMSSLRKLDLDIGDTAGEEVPTLPLQLEELTMNEFTGGHLQSIQWMPNLRRLHLMGYSEDELEFTAMPEHCGLQYIDVAISSDPTTLSLVRANRATLSELQVYCATRPGRCFINNLSASLHQCGANGLRRLTLRRNPCHHDLWNCRLQLEAFRARFGPGVDVQCSLCVDE